MDALVAVTGPESGERLRESTARMLDAIWPDFDRQEAAHVADGVALAVARTAAGALAVGLPRLRGSAGVRLAQRFDWRTVGETVDAVADWLAALEADPTALPSHDARLAGIACHSQSKSLSVLQDPLGESPFWYAHEGERFAVATHPAALLALEWVRREPDLLVTAAVESGVAIAAEETPWRGIHRVPPGHRLVFREGRLQSHRWWALFPTEHGPAADRPDDWFLLARQTLERAVARRVPAAGMVGAQLSGGLDSTAVALLASSLLQSARRGMHTFSHVPAVRWNPPQAGDETPYVEAALACMPGAVPHFVTGIAAEESLIGHGTLHPHDREVRAAARDAGVLCLLSGWGGDEGVSYNGDGFLAGECLRGRVWWVLRWCYHFGGGHWRGMLGSFLAKVIQQQLGLINPTAVHRLPRRQELERRLAGQPPQIRESLRARRRQQQTLRGSASAHENQRRLLQSSHLGNRIAMDTMWSVPAGLHFRYPLLDPDVLSLALAVPERLFMMGWRTRTLLRNAMLGIYPELIQRRHGKFVSHPAPLVLATP